MENPIKIMYHRVIDMARKLPVLPLDAVQNDGNTRAVEIVLLENGEPWNVPEGITAAVAFRKPDRTKGLYDRLPDGSAAVTIEGSTVTAVLAPQVLSCAGEVSAAVVFHDADLNQLATFPFTLRVAANPAAGQSVSNDYYQYSTMEEVSEAVVTALASLEESKQDFLTKAEEALAVVHDTATEDAPAIICEAFGTAVAVRDASDRPLSGLSVFGKTTQNGTPTPESPVALESVGASGSICVTVAGKNLISIDSVIISETNKIGSVQLSTLPTGKYVFSASVTKYTDDTATNTRMSVSVYYADGSYKTYSGISASGISENDGIARTKTVQFDVEDGRGAVNNIILRTSDYSNTATRSAKAENIQLEIGDTATEYEPYKPAQTLTVPTPNGLPGIPVTSGGNYTDENGQDWVCDEVDFARGVYVQRLNTKVFDGSDDEPWIYGNSYINYPNSSTLYARIWMPLSTIGIASDSFVLCDKLSNYGVGANYAPKHGAELWTNTTNFHVLPGKGYLDSENSIGTMRQWLSDNPITVLYELEAPIETPLSAGELAAFAALHSNKPNTTVFNDGGAGMKLAYVADTKLYIDQKLAAISAAILG